MSDVAERLWEVIEPYVAQEGIELDDIEIVGNGSSSILRVTIDSDDSIDVDRVARISRGVSRLLDEADPIAGSYTLEVSTPGLERKLRRPQHYAKAVGREVKVKSRMPIDGDRQHRGIVSAATETDFTIDTESESRTIPYRDVASARTVFVWEKKAKPGSAKH